ncbi:hypothetical protein AFLA_000785 [Aspergillus flavus NRRL3357]|nr:hypothetical protein AFLA_000785 [Aspergillus flavus NRRL3357]
MTGGAHKADTLPVHSLPDLQILHNCRGKAENIFISRINFAETQERTTEVSQIASHVAYWLDSFLAPLLPIKLVATR